jgi:hypothetical protein
MTVLRNPATAHPTLNPTAPKRTNRITLVALMVSRFPAYPLLTELVGSTLRQGREDNRLDVHQHHQPQQAHRREDV